MADAFAASQRSNIVISFNAPIGTILNYHIKPELFTIEGIYDHWVATRQPPLFGTEPDARVSALANEAADPTTHRYSISAPEPGATPCRWPGAATPPMWSR